MHLFRTFFYLILAGNIVLAILSGMSFAGVHAPWQAPGESERINRQLVPEKIVLLQEARPASSPDTAAAPPQPAAQPAALPAADTPACIAFASLGNADVEAIKSMAAPAGNALKLKINGVQPSSYWVNIPPSGGKDGANRRGEILAKAGITDFIIVRESGPNQYAISLGLFRNEDAARRLVEQLQKKNIKTAIITTRDNTGKAARIEIHGMSSQLQATSSEIRARLKTAQSDECGAGG